jgi:hypothetical protein
VDFLFPEVIDVLIAAGANPDRCRGIGDVGKSGMMD